MDFPPLKTERLSLRTLTLADTPEVFTHYSDPDVMRYINDTEPCVSPADAAEIISFHERDIGCRYGVFLEPDASFIGSCGFHRWRTSPHPVAEVGYDLSPAQWGNGYMREAVTALLDYGFESMGLEEIEAGCAVENERSLQLLQRLGFAGSGPEGELRFVLRAHTWRDREA